MSNMQTEEELERRKLEEALEVKSLRRIISAYLNYPEAAEEDVKRWERSFRKLPPRHKALLSHLPSKFQKLRWCIAQNSYFIFEMLKVFEPPLDMSQDIDNCENQHLDVVSDSHHSSRSRNPCLCESTSTSGGVNCHSLAEPISEETCNGKFPAPTNVNEEQDIDISKKSIAGKCSISLEDHGSANNICGDGCKNLPDRDTLYASACCNGNVSSSSPDWLDPSLQLHVPLVDVDKVRCIIRNIVRDWAKEGQQERDQCYRPILEELERLFPDRSNENPPACLVPGAGLGRLALEISCLGFACQGNEFSYYMMICSSFILNHAQAAGEWTIFPWIHSNCNSVSDNDQLRPVSVPDIHPASAGITEGFSMCGGDFVEVYSDPSQGGVWDAVVTCFFLDTAHNIVEYIEIISEVLKDGGVWINLGPLLYHFADMYSQEDVSSMSTKSNNWLYVLYLDMDDILVFLLLLPPPPKYPGNVNRTELGGCEKGCSSVWIYLRERINYRDNIHYKLTVNDAKPVLCCLLDDAQENISNPVVVKLSSISCLHLCVAEYKRIALIHLYAILVKACGFSKAEEFKVAIVRVRFKSLFIH